MGHPDLKLPTSGFVPNQHRRRVSLPASPPETPATFTGFFPKGAGSIPAHLNANANNTFTFPISPPATPTRPQTLTNETLPTHAHQRLPSYDEKYRRQSWHHHRRVSTASLVRMAGHTTRRQLTPTKIITLLLILLSGSFLVSLILTPSRPKIVKVAVATPPPKQAAYQVPSVPMRPQRFGKSPERHLADEKERMRWAESLPNEIPHQIHVVPVEEVDTELQHDVLREHPESFVEQRPAMRLRPGKTDIEEDEDEIGGQAAEPAPKPVFYVGGRPIYKQRQKGPERVQIGKAAEAPVVEVEEEVEIESKEAEILAVEETPEAEEEEVELPIKAPAKQPVVEEAALEVEAEEAEEVEPEEEVVVVIPAKAKVAAAKGKVTGAKGRGAVAKGKGAVAMGKGAVIAEPVVIEKVAPVPPAPVIVEPAPRVDHEAEISREKILAGLGRHPGRVERPDAQNQRQAMLKQIKQMKAAQAGAGAIDSSTPAYKTPADEIGKDPRDTKRKVMKNPATIRKKGAGKARMEKKLPVVPDSFVKKPSRPQAEEWRHISGDEDEGDEPSYKS